MKTIEQLYDEIKRDDNLKSEFSAAMQENKLEEFAKAHECEASVTDIMSYVRNTKTQELNLDDLENVAGGACTTLSCDISCGCPETMPGFC